MSDWQGRHRRRLVRHCRKCRRRRWRTLPYPAQIGVVIPIISDLPGLSDVPYWPQSLKRSEEIGAGYLEHDIAATPATQDNKVTIVAMSQGTQVAEIARADMAKAPNYIANAGNYSFILIGDPYQPNGGILARFTSWSRTPVLGDLFPLGRPGPSDSPFQTTIYQNQYDGFADFPAYFNPLAIANALIGIPIDHAFPGYVLEHPDGANAVTTQVGNTTYVTLPQYLPLLAPLRTPASLIGAQRFVDALDPILRVFIEMGYDRTADPSQVKQFSWATPPDKLQEALKELPGAFAQSLSILAGKPYIPTMPAPVVSGTEPLTPVTVHPADPADTSPAARSVRQFVLNFTRSLNGATRQLATVLQAIGGAPRPQTTVAPTAALASANTKPAPTALTSAADGPLGSRAAAPTLTPADAKAAPTTTAAATKVAAAQINTDVATPSAAATTPAATTAAKATAKSKAAVNANADDTDDAVTAPPPTPSGHTTAARSHAPRTDARRPRLSLVPGLAGAAKAQHDDATAGQSSPQATSKAPAHTGAPAAKQPAKATATHHDRTSTHDSAAAG